MFRMQSFWKGAPIRRLTVFDKAKGFCNGEPWFEAGETYLVFAARSRHGWDSLGYCGGTAPESSSLGWIQRLGKPTIVQRLPGRKLRSPH